MSGLHEDNNSIIAYNLLSIGLSKNYLMPCEASVLCKESEYFDTKMMHNKDFVWHRHSPLFIAEPKNTYLRCAAKTRICPIFPGIHMIRNIVATITCTLNAGKLCSNQWCGTLSMYSGSLSSKYVRKVLFEDNYLLLVGFRFLFISSNKSFRNWIATCRFINALTRIFWLY